MSGPKSSRRFATLTEALRYLTRGLVGPISRKLLALGIHPDLITFAGLVLVGVAAYMIARGELLWAAVFIIIGASMDALDGAVARAMERTGKFGALWDSTLDRYADGFIYMGFALYFVRQDDEIFMLLSMFALLGSLLVSYVRARAGGLRIDCEMGLFTRIERMLILMIMLMTGWVKPGIWILVIGTNFTVAQRVWHVYRALKQAGR